MCIIAGPVFVGVFLILTMVYAIILIFQSNNRVCAVPRCKSTGKSVNACAKRKITFHKFPLTTTRKKEWLVKIRRDEGKHFKVSFGPSYILYNSLGGIVFQKAEFIGPLMVCTTS